MLHIGICTDDRNLSWKLERCIQNYTKETKLEYDVEVFWNGTDYLKYLVQNPPLDLLFLDIDLEDMTGIAVGQKLRAKLENEITQIVFLSEKDTYAMQLFPLRPMNFLLKPLPQEAVFAVLEEYQRLYGNFPIFFQYSLGKQKVHIRTSQIAYFQCQGKKIVIKSAVGDSDGAGQEFYGKMQDVMKQVGKKSFCQIHKSYIVNINHIALFQPDKVILLDGTVLPVSRANKKAVAECLMA